MQVSTILKNLDLTKIQNSIPNTNAANLSIRSTFPTKLYEMLMGVEREGKESIVSWNPDDGRSFKVHEPKKFVTDILPNYFRQTQYKSFQRQLNFYGFVRFTHGPLVGSYSNPLFVRGNEDQVRRIKKKNVKKQKTTTVLRAYISKNSALLSDSISNNKRSTIIMRTDIVNELIINDLNPSSCRRSSIGYIKLKSNNNHTFSSSSSSISSSSSCCSGTAFSQKNAEQRFADPDEYNNTISYSYYDSSDRSDIPIDMIDDAMNPNISSCGGMNFHLIDATIEDVLLL